MFELDYVQAMARYNRWQNENLVGVADTLSTKEREMDRGSFFGSIQQTFSHLLWADELWVSRFAGTPMPDGGIPESRTFFSDWIKFQIERERFDKVILEWASSVERDWFDGDLSWYSGALGRDITKPKKIAAIQLFNHQTHHRGQIHAMLTSAGARPSDTDVPFMPEHYDNL